MRRRVGPCPGTWAGRLALRRGLLHHSRRCDGQPHRPLGRDRVASSGQRDGTTDHVNALAFGPDGSLYAGGKFTTAGGVTANHIARWDGSDWHPLGSGIEGRLLELCHTPWRLGRTARSTPEASSPRPAG